MRSMRTTAFLAVALVAVMTPPALHTAERTTLRAMLTTLKGTVSTVAPLSGEGDLMVIAVELAVEEPPREIIVLLAPEGTLSEIGFEVAPGDRLRVRVFPSEEGPLPAHKVMNISRGMMARLRTLKGVPLWDGSGRWQGGPGGHEHGRGARGGRRHRGADSPRRP